MELNQAHHENSPEPHEKAPAELLLPLSLKGTSDPAPFNEDNKNKMNNVGADGGDELESVRVSIVTNDEKHSKVVTTMEIDENTNPVMVTQTLNTDDEDTAAVSDQEKTRNEIPKPESSCHKIGEVPNPNKRSPFGKNFLKEKSDIEKSDSKVEVLYQKSSQNNNNCNEEDFMLWDTKAAYLDKLLCGNECSRWNRNGVGYGFYGDFKDFRKRIAYIGMLLSVGISCAILALMKICGGADWMNTATFSVIIMGTVLLLPPGLYYGHIVVCIGCRCKGYSLWDVPQGPFG